MLFRSEGNGPMNGDPKKMNVLLLSADPIALDATVCRLVDLKPEYSFTISIGMQAGHGTYLDSEITLLGDSPDGLIARDFNVNRNPISNLLRDSLFGYKSDEGLSKPFITDDKCLRCGVCIEVCPISPKAVDWRCGDNTQPPVYDYSKCIRCFCCQELCPHGAIVVK